MLDGVRALVAYDIYPGDDPIDGTLLVRLTEDDCQKGTYWRAVFRGAGEGKIILHADHAAIAAGHFVEGNYVRVVDRSAGFSEEVIGGFWLQAGDEVVVSKRELGGEFRSLGGPGTLDILNRASWPATLRSPFDDLLAQHQAFQDENGYLRFSGETYGGILGRLYEEILQDDPSPFPPGMPGRTWSDGSDTNSVPWTATSGPYDLTVGDKAGEIALAIMRNGVDFFINPDSFTPTAYVAGTVGTDRTSPVFASGKVRFERGINIRNDLSKAIHASAYASHVLAKGQDGISWEEAVDPDWSPGDPVIRDTINVANTSDPAVLQDAAEESIRLRKLAQAEARFPIVSGNAPLEGLYTAGNGRHFNVGTLVTLHTGTGAHEFDEQPIQVAAIEWRIESGRGHDVWVELGAQYIDSQSAREIRSLTTLIRDTGGLKLCTALSPGTETLSRLYFTNTAATPRTGSAGWTGGVADMVSRVLSFTPSGAADSFADWAAVNQSAASFGLLQGTIGLSNAGLLAAIQNGSAFRIQTRIGVRHGIGIDESSHIEFLEGTIRVWRSSSSSFIGTALSVGAATGAVQALTDPAGTLSNRSMAGTASAVPGAISTDELVVELGIKHQAPTSGGAGAAVWWNDAAASDLPEDDSTTSNLRSWIEFRSTTDPSGSGLHPDLVGTDTSASRCDHRHHILSTRNPTAADDISQGYPTTTLWTNTETNQSFVLVDEDTGEWVPFATAGEHTHTVDEITDFPTTGSGTSEIVSHGAMGAAETFDFTDGADHLAEIDDDTVITLDGATNGERAMMTIRVTQDSTGGWIPSFAGTVVDAGVVDNWDVTPDAENFFTALSDDGGTVWFIFPAGATATASGGRWKPVMAEDVGDGHWYVVVDGDGSAVMVEF